MRLVRTIYDLTRSFPKEKTFGLTGQMHRAAVSIPSNLAERAARTGRKEFVQFFSIAKGSLSELETQLPVPADLGYACPDHEIFPALDRVSTIDRRPSPES